MGFEVEGIRYKVNVDEKSVSVIENEYQGDVLIPSSVMYNGVVYPVTEIGWSAFSGCSGLTSVEIPNSVTAIDNWAFNGCSGLTSVVIPDSVTSIGENAFEGCSGLTSVVIPDSVTEIGWSAFRGCSGLTSVVIPDSVTAIGDWAFEGCSGLTSIEIPNSVTAIGNGAFGNTTYYTNQPKGLVYLGRVLYRYKGTIPENASIIIKEGTISISPAAFEGCSGLTNVVIPDSVTAIGLCAFPFCI